MADLMTVGFLRNAAYWALFAWLCVDGLMVFTRYTRKASSADRGSLFFIMLVFWGSIFLAMTLAFRHIGEFGDATVSVQFVGFAVMLCGIAIRSLAIHQLGRLHMPVVAIQADHPLMDKGLYGLVRHPSYLGATLAFLGFGLALGSWPAALLTLVGALVGYGYRIRVEERALVQGLGERYVQYMGRTRRLVPWIY